MIVKSSKLRTKGNVAMMTLRNEIPYCHPIAARTHDIDPKFAQAMTEIFINWGSIEHWMYRVLEAVDMTKRPEWIELFFRPLNTNKRVEAVRKEARKAALKMNADFSKRLDDAFDCFDDIRSRRNTLAHGAWRERGEKFAVAPLRLKKGKQILEPEIEFDSAAARKLADEINKLVEQLAELSIELMVHWKHKSDAARE